MTEFAAVDNSNIYDVCLNTYGSLDMLVKLMKKVDWNRERCAKMQTVGIIHAGMFLIYEL